MSIPFTFTDDGDTGKFEGKIELNRLDYNVGSKSLMMSNTVTVNLLLNTKKK